MGIIRGRLKMSCGRQSQSEPMAQSRPARRRPRPGPLSRCQPAARRHRARQAEAAGGVRVPSSTVSRTAAGHAGLVSMYRPGISGGCVARPAGPALAAAGHNEAKFIIIKEVYYKPICCSDYGILLYSRNRMLGEFPSQNNLTFPCRCK